MDDGIREISKGNTEIVAETIAKLTNGDLFEVVPLIDYPNNYGDCCDIAKKELNSNARPELKTYLNDITKYDVIYIGYPMWWGTLPMPLWTQLEKLDFQGKIVKPFTTHEGSGLGQSEKDVKKLCQGATLKSGFAIRGSLAHQAESGLKNWIEK